MIHFRSLDLLREYRKMLVLNIFCLSALSKIYGINYCFKRASIINSNASFILNCKTCNSHMAKILLPSMILQSVITNWSEFEIQWTKIVALIHFELKKPKTNRCCQNILFFIAFLFCLISTYTWQRYESTWIWDNSLVDWFRNLITSQL